MILERLKQETANLHLATEASMPFADPSFDEKDYVGLLQRSLGFFVTWESAAVRVSDPAIAALVRERSRLEALVQDLRFFQVSVATESMPADYLPDLTCPANVLGSMYVLEGSTLGGQLIARMLENRLALREEKGYSFYVGAGSSTGTRWKAFGRVLTDWSTTCPGQEESILAAARKTFEAYCSWVGASVHEKVMPL